MKYKKYYILIIHSIITRCHLIYNIIVSNFSKDLKYIADRETPLNIYYTSLVKPKISLSAIYNFFINKLRD